MKPILAIASLMTGAATMGMAVYVTHSPNAFVSRTAKHRPSASSPVPAPRVEIIPKVEELPLQVQPIRIVGAPRRIHTRHEVAEPQLSACSDWRALGPTATRVGDAVAEHRVKLLCPEGQTAEQTFFAEPPQVVSLSGLFDARPKGAGR